MHFGDGIGHEVSRGKGAGGGEEPAFHGINESDTAFRDAKFLTYHAAVGTVMYYCVSYVLFKKGKEKKSGNEMMYLLMFSQALRVRKVPNSFSSSFHGILCSCAASV